MARNDAKSRRARRVGSVAGVAAALFAAVITSPTYAAERKSIRWATSSVDSYGYKVAAAMVKIAEDSLGGEYTITVNPYPATTAAMKAAMDGNGEIGYTADVGMTQLYAAEGGFKNYTPAKGKLVHTWYAYPMESFMAVPAEKAAQFKCLKDLSGKPTFFTPALATRAALVGTVLVTVAWTTIHPTRRIGRRPIDE